MNYDRNWVLAAYRAEHDQRRNPNAQILANYDQALFNLYDAEITAQANGLVLTPFRRSILAYYASRSQAAGPAVQVRHAYEFFNNTNPVP